MEGVEDSGSPSSSSDLGRMDGIKLVLRDGVLGC